VNNNITTLSIACILVCTLVGCGDHPTEQNDKLNIILFVSDDHGTDALGCYGNPVVHTPNLDRLAEEGARFTNAFCTASTCSASRSVILTGKFSHATAHYGHSHSYHHFSTYDTIIALPTYLEEVGYHTARIGKYHLAPESVYSFNEVLKADPRNTVEMAEKCRGVIEGDQPFFLYFCTDDPHRGAPFDLPAWDAPNSFGNKEEGYPGVEKTVYNPDEVIVPDFLPDTPECRKELAQYYQSVSRIDQGFGRLMDILEVSGKAENTVVIYISDNGIAFPGAKTTTYDPGILLPCIVRAPGQKEKGVVKDEMISWVDLTPTVMDYAGMHPEEMYFHGRSFKPVMDGEESNGWDEIYCSHIFHEVTMYYPMRVIRNRQYKLIWNIAWRLEYPFATDLWAASTWQGVYMRGDALYGKRKVENYLNRPEFELYDIQQDPDEINNLADIPEYKSVRDSLINRIKQFQMDTRDPWIISWEHKNEFGSSGVNL
jgi:N-sulfoglucosamine sulfohydrolase